MKLYLLLFSLVLAASNASLGITAAQTQKKLKNKYESMMRNKSEIEIGLDLDEINIFAEILRDNNTLKKLKIIGVPVGAFGAALISDALKVNKTLISLEISQANIGDEGAEYIADALKVNKTLQTLILQKDNITEKGADFIAKALYINRTLTTLDLSFNHKTTNGRNTVDDPYPTWAKGNAAIYDVMKVNKTLKHFINEPVDISHE